MLSLPRRLQTDCQQLKSPLILKSDGLPSTVLGRARTASQGSEPALQLQQRCASALAGGLWPSAHCLLCQERARLGRQTSVQTPCLP